MSVNRIVVVAAGLSLSAAACVSVRPIQPAQFIPQNNPEVVWVRYNDGSFVPVRAPRISGDTLKGMWQGQQEPVSIPLADIQSVQAKVSDHTKTIILVSVLGVAAGLTAYAATQGGGSFDARCTQYGGGGNQNCTGTM
jgi:hypothetical protein